MVAITSGCQGHMAWRERIALVAARKESTFVDVGANKGYNTVAFMELWSAHNVTGRAWHGSIRQYASEQLEKRLLGSDRLACGDCNRYCYFPPLPSIYRQQVHATAHMLELQRSNRKLLRSLIRANGLEGVVHVHDVGASNVTAEVLTKTRGTGSEDGSIQMGPIPHGRAQERTHVVRLDDFFQQHALRDIYHVKIDTEGHDDLVLQGLHHTLKQQRVSVLEFEYSGKGFWAEPGQSLEQTLTWLKSLGYFCFWLAPHDLVPASPPCWLGDFDERRSWSNLACSWERPILREMHRISAEGVQRRRRICGHGGPATMRLSREDRLRRDDVRGVWCGHVRTMAVG